MQKILKQSIIIGILIILSGTIFSFGLGQFLKDIGGLPPLCPNNAANAAMAVVFFLSGFLTHIVASLVGIEKWFNVSKIVNTKPASPKRISPKNARPPIVIQP